MLRCLFKPINLRLALKLNAFYRDRGNQVEETSQLPVSFPGPLCLLLLSRVQFHLPGTRPPSPGSGALLAFLVPLLVRFAPWSSHLPSEMMFHLLHCPGWNTSFMPSSPQAHLLGLSQDGSRVYRLRIIKGTVLEKWKIRTLCLPICQRWWW